MKNKRSTRALRGLTGLTSSLLVVALGTTTIANAWASKINEYLGTTNISVSGETSDSDDAYYYKSDYDNTTDLINARNDVMTKIQEEGTVLLKNDNQALPLKNSPKVTLFGMTSYAPVYGGTVGSSSPAKQDLSFKDCFENAGIQVNPTMWSFYEKMSKDYKRMALAPTWFGFTGAEMEAQTIRTGEVPVEKYTDTERGSYSDYNDAAVVVIGRQGSEADDFGTSTDNVQDGDGTHLALGLQDVERDMINEAKKNFDKVIVLINSDNPMEIEELKEDKDIDSILWIGEPGTVGLQGVASVLTGEVSPSGHLPDTYAVSSVSSPAMVNFGSYTFTNATEDNFGASNYSGSNYLVESEGIYTGYKYYETRYEDTVLKQGNADSAAGASNDNGTWNYDEEVSYGFGYGLSYTTFEQNIKNFDYEGDSVTVSVEVKNTGDVAGKDVVQLYYTAPYTPGGIEKSAVVLGAFAKTDLLQPGESQTVSMTMNYDDMASYDYKTDKCYVLDAGTYTLSLRSDAHTVKNDLTYDFTVDQTIKYDTTARSTDETVATNQFDDVTAGDGNIGTTLPYLSRADWEGTYPSREASENATANAATIALLTNGNGGSTIDLNDDPAQGTTYTNGEKNGVMLADAAGIVDPDNAVWEQLMNHMSVDEMNNLYGNCGWCSPAVDSIGKPQATECDGPNGIHDLASGLEAAEYATETVLAATWNVDLALKEGEAYGDEDLVNGVSGTYGPGMNIHRSAFGGRAAEYYSEDPLLSGMMAANMVTGLQSRGIYVFAKHFALNDQDTNRGGVCIWSNEQAMREIYLRAFEVAIHNVTGDGLNQLGLTGIMESYNRIGTSMVGYSYAMLTQVLRNEWGFQGVVNTDAFAVSNGDLALRAGVDMQLAMGVNVTDTTLKSGYGMQLLRQATKRHLMVLANSSLMTTTRNWTPYWLIALGVVDVILVVAIVLIALHMFKPELFAKKKNKKKAAKA